MAARDVMSARRREIAAEVGRKVAEARLAKGWTRAELARRAKLPPHAIKQCELGERLLSRAHRLTFAKLFKIDPEDLWIEECCPRCGARQN